VSDPRIDALCEQVRQARAAGDRLLIRGASSRPWTPRQGSFIDLRDCAGVVSYAPTELVITVRAGTPLTELDAALAERGQMLAAECPNFNGRSTIGGALAVGWSGSRSAFAGQLRDCVLGLRMINGLGEDLRFGGQVMKNVAGFDVSRLMVGSLGRLGVITEVSLRVQPLPERELTLRWRRDNLEQAVAAVRDWQGQGLPVSAASYHLGILRTRFSGRAATLDALAAQLGGEPVEARFWQDLRCLSLPLFESVDPRETLYDCNGEVSWTAHSYRRGAAAPVMLDSGPAIDTSGGTGELRRRVVAAFDPDGVFQPAREA